MEENNTVGMEADQSQSNTGDQLRTLAESVAAEAESLSCESDNRIQENNTDEVRQTDDNFAIKQREADLERQSVKQLMDSYLQSVAATERLKIELENIKKQSSAEELFKNPEYVRKAADNENVEKLVIEKYLKKLAGGGSVEVLGSDVGTIAAASVRIPETLKEAKRIADMMMRN